MYKNKREEENVLKKLIEQFIKFGIIGAIATVVDWGIYAIMVEIYGAADSISGIMTLSNWKILATIVSFSFAVVVNYLCSMKYVFERRDDMNRVKEIVIFFVLSIIGLGINILIIDGLEGIEEWFKTWPAIIYRFAYMIPKVIATMVVLVWNFVSRKIFLEKK